MKLVIHIGDPEMKHWPAPFAGVAPKIRAWLKDEATGAQVELPTVQKLEVPYALRDSWSDGHYRIVFEGGEFTAAENDVEMRGHVVIDGEVVEKQRRLDMGEVIEA